MSQLPHDPASGAPRSDRTVCEFLAAAGFRVRCLATTATEQAQPGSVAGILSLMGITPRTINGETALGPRPVHEFQHRGIDYTLLDTGEHDMESWMRDHNEQFDALLERMLAKEVPDITYVYGGLPRERIRRSRLRNAGSIIVFTLHNWGYLDPRAFDDIDLVLTPSQHVTDKYREALGVESTVAPVPILESDVVPQQHRPTFVTFINPTHNKGAALVARIAEDICAKRADIPFLIINARRTAANLVRAGRAAGYDLRRHKSIVYSEGVPSPAEIYALTRIVILPSVWPEPAGRVTAEAMLCGIPAIVGNRGGMHETSRGAAYCLSLPDRLQPGAPCNVTSEDARQWVQTIERLFDDPAEYAAACTRSREAGEYYRQPALTAWYAELFQHANRRESPIISLRG